MDNILTKVEKLNQYFQAHSDQPPDTRMLQRAVKLNEEVGELCEAILTETDPDQRVKDRTIDFDAELADVIISALMLSTGRTKSIEVEINKKLDRVLERFNLLD